MKSLIITNGSKTTQKDSEDTLMMDYFKGSFKIVSKLAEELNEYTDLETFIVSDDFGLIKGEENFKDVKNRNLDKNEEILSRILPKVRNTDVLIILLTGSKFESI